MLHIILLILKIIGIILLCILGVVLLALCCVLFVPVRYRIEVLREEGEGKPPVVVRAKTTWMLHLVNILICYPADVYVRARIFLFTLFRVPDAGHPEKTPDQKKKRKKSRKKSTTENEQKKQTDGKEIQTEPVDRTSTERDRIPADINFEDSAVCAGESQNTGIADKAAQNDSLHSSTAGPEALAASGNESVSGEGTDESSTEPQDSGFMHKIAGIIRKIKDFVVRILQIPDKIKTLLEKIRYTIHQFCDKIKSTSDTIKYYCEVLQSEAFSRSWTLCKDQLGIILKEIKPDKFEADMIIGTDDPASTGEILAIFGMLYPWIGQHVRIAGDFERSRIEGQIFLKGKVHAFTFLRIALKVYRNKDIKTLIKLFKKEAV